MTHATGLVNLCPSFAIQSITQQIRQQGRVYPLEIGQEYNRHVSTVSLKTTYRISTVNVGCNRSEENSG